MDKISAIILAAGKGTRMHSQQTNKVMLPVNGKPMVSYTVENMQRAGLKTIIMVVGFAKESIMEYFKDQVQYALQEEQKGTAHALICGLTKVPADCQTILLVYGDDSYTYPPALYQKLIAKHNEQSADVTILSVYLEDPSGLGRIMRDDGQHITDIVEEKNATVEQKRVREINTGCYVFSRTFLEEYLPKISDKNAAHEYLLTDIIKLAVKNGKTVADVRETNLRWRGVNRPEELEQAQTIIA